MKVVICETMLRPSVVSVPSESKGDGSAYEVVSSTLFNDSFCTCPGFQFRGYCKHVTMVGNARCTFNRAACETDFKDWWDDKLGTCPTCSSKLILFNMEPEWE
jgi:hypothetical protein